MNKILVTGGSGLVGTHLRKYLPHATYISSKQFDLTNELDVIRLFETKWDAIIHLAAKVGGILENSTNQGIFFEENILMNTLLLKYAKIFKVPRLISILSTCMYPDIVSSYPMTLKDMHYGPPALTNFSYGYAKRSLAVQIDSYKHQWNLNWSYIVPCNLYGEGDKDLEHKSHFVTALIKKIYLARLNNETSITLFGDGTPLRQFVHADDLARIIELTLNRNISESFNFAPDENLSIKQIADVAIDSTGTPLNIEFDTSKPKGQMRKDVSSEDVQILFPDFKFTPLEEGIKKVYKAYEKNKLSI
jgi:GDP-L-fucose synthase